MCYAHSLDYRSPQRHFIIGIIARVRSCPKMNEVIRSYHSKLRNGQREGGAEENNQKLKLGLG